MIAFSFLVAIAVLALTFSSVNAAGNGFKGLRMATRLVHAGCEPDSNSADRAVVPPISLSTTFIQSYPGVKPGMNDPNSHGTGFFYSRQANPTRGALERALAVVEEAEYASVFASGLASFTAVIQLLQSGDHVIALDDLYGGTSGMFRNIAGPSSGIQFTFMDLDNLEAVEKACTEKTKMIWLESPTNPFLKTTDIRALAALAKKKGILLVVDNTFMSPYLQQPLKLGADIVVHSLTKHIAGHCDVVMGAAITNNAEINKKLKALQNFCGAVPSPFDCYMTLRGMKTLHLRLEAAQKNAMQVAEVLENHPVIEKVIYPGLKSYPRTALHQSQASGPGTMVTIYVKGGLPIAGKFLSELKVFGLAVSLGAVQSLACSPALMTHTAVPKDVRESLGLTDSLVRLSIGVEHGDDLVADLKQALDKAYADFQKQEGGGKR